MLDLIDQSTISLWHVIGGGSWRVFSIPRQWTGKLHVTTLHSMYQAGRCFFGRLDPGDDVLDALKRLCAEHDVWTAYFQLTGSVTAATFGVFDLQQRVYITERVDQPLEVLSCCGNITAASDPDAVRFINAGLVSADGDGKILGGRLFSPTVVFAVEFVLQELIGEHHQRSYDPWTGMQSWPAVTAQR